MQYTLTLAQGNEYRASYFQFLDPVSQRKKGDSIWLFAELALAPPIQYAGKQGWPAIPHGSPGVRACRLLYRLPGDVEDAICYRRHV